VKKVKASEKSGSSPDDIYVPTLWYFEDFEVMEDQGQTLSFLIHKKTGFHWINLYQNLQTSKSKKGREKVFKIKIRCTTNIKMDM
jgi:hypothetical protein